MGNVLARKLTLDNGGSLWLFFGSFYKGLPALVILTY